MFRRLISRILSESLSWHWNMCWATLTSCHSQRSISLWKSQSFAVLSLEFVNVSTPMQLMMWETMREIPSDLVPILFPYNRNLRLEVAPTLDWFEIFFLTLVDIHCNGVFCILDGVIEILSLSRFGCRLSFLLFVLLVAYSCILRVQRRLWSVQALSPAPRWQCITPILKGRLHCGMCRGYSAAPEPTRGWGAWTFSCDGSLSIAVPSKSLLSLRSISSSSWRISSSDKLLVALLALNKLLER